MAILAVVTFHFFPAVLPSGFAGVDVFFVISGYLITRILLSSQDRHAFSIAAFYAARVRRLFPALLLVLAATMLAGLACLDSAEREQLGAHVVAGAGFVANLHLWREAGYFDAAIESKPLAHLWSLGVEEQFYFAWPLALWLLLRRGALPWGTALLLLASMAAGIVVVRNDPTTAFYFPLLRAWEPLAGALLAIVERRGLPAILRGQADALSAWGFGLLVLAGFELHAGLPYPSGWALLPVTGAVLLIAAGPAARLNRLLLANRPMVWVGRISYPLYLWHWPVLAFVRIAFNAEPAWPGMLLLLALSVALAGLTWRFVERPLRDAGAGRLKAGALALGMATIVPVALSLGAAPALSPDTDWASAIPLRPSFQMDHDPVLAEGCGLASPAARPLVHYCLHDTRGRQRFALLGDSKAEALYDGLVRTSAPAARWLFMGGSQQHSALVPVLTDLPQYQHYQATLHVALEGLRAHPEIETVVVAASARALYQLARTDSLEELPGSRNQEAAREGLRRFTSELLRAGKRVVFVVDNPALPDPRKCLLPARFEALKPLAGGLLQPVSRRCELTVESHRELAAPYHRLLAEVRQLAPGRITVFDTLPLLCDMAAGICRSMDSEGVLYSYSDHISALAAKRIGAALNAQLLPAPVDPAPGS